jgi:DNA-binding winged helix-turn-helix (wHTH) protein/Flp pilus assembly protein TadD
VTYLGVDSWRVPGIALGDASNQARPGVGGSMSRSRPDDRPPAAGPVLEFAGFRFDPERGLSQAGKPVHLARKEQRGLGALLARRGAPVSRHEYAQAAWRGGDASDESIARSIYLLRRALGCGDRVAVLETIHGFGYRISTEIREVRPGAPSTAAKTVQGVSVAAFETFQLGRESLARRTPSDLEAAVRAFRRATEIDATYAAPWAAIADCHINQSMRWYLAPKSAGQLALEAVARALAIDPGAADALAARGWVTGVIGQAPTEGLADLDRAVALDPQYWRARFYRAWLLPVVGEHEQALAEARAACELNPLHPVPRSMVGWMLFCAGRTDEALQSLRTAADELGQPRQILRVLSVVTGWAGRTDEALAVARSVEENERFAPDGTTVLAYALARAGDAESARRIVRRWEEPSGAHPAPTHMAAVYLALGDREKAGAAIAWAERDACPQLAIARRDPRLVGLRSPSVTAGSWSGAISVPDTVAG